MSFRAGPAVSAASAVAGTKLRYAFLKGWSGQSGRRVRSGQPAHPGLIAAAPRAALFACPAKTRETGTQNWVMLPILNAVPAP